MKTPSSTTRPRFLSGVLLATLLSLAAVPQAMAQYVVTTLGVAVTENFNSYAGTAAPANWTLAANNRTSPNNTANGSAGFVGNDTGSSSAGGWRNYGNTGSGSLGFTGNANFGSGNGANNYPAIMTTQFSNNTGSLVTSFLVGYTGEQWRRGDGRASFILAYYSLDGTSFTELTSLRFNAPNISGAGNNTALNGDAAANRTVFSAVNVNSLSVANGSSIWFRWTYNGSDVGSGARQGLSIDDISVTFNGGGPPLATDYFWTGGDGTLGGSGTWATTGTTWSATNSPITEVVWDSSKKAIFAGTAGTVTVSSVSADAGLVFSNTGYQLTGGTLTLGGASIGANSLTTDTGVTTTVNTVLAGTAGLTKAGAGTLILGGGNSISGGLAINAGGLSVSADGNLGAAGNDVALGGGTLVVTDGFTSGSGRDFTGSGSIDIAPSEVLQVDGLFNMSALTVTNAGTLYLNGATRSVGALTLGGAATIDASGAITVTSIDAAGLTSGTATINNAIAFSSAGDKNLNVGTGGRVVVAGDISGTTGRIIKLGQGTLVANGGNTTSGFRLGAAGTTNGGTLILGAAAAMGTNTFQFNWGTLQASSATTFTNDLSIGGREPSAAVVGGTNAIVFSGNVSWFNGGSNTFVQVNNQSTMSGVISSATGDVDLVFGGAGTLTMSGSAANTFTNDLILSNTLTVNLNKDEDVTAVAGNVTVNSGATLLISASGMVSDTSEVTLSGGTLARGSGVSESFGDLTLTSNSFLDYGGGAFGTFEFSGLNYTPSGSLVLNLANFTAGSTLVINGTSDWTSLIGTAFTFSGTGGFGSSSFSSGTFTITAVPEPSTIVAALGLAGLLLWPARRRILKDTQRILGLRRPMRDRLERLRA